MANRCTHADLGETFCLSCQKSAREIIAGLQAGRDAACRQSAEDMRDRCIAAWYDSAEDERDLDVILAALPIDGDE